MKKGARHLINHFPHASASEKRETKEALAQKKRGGVAADAPARNTRQQSKSEPKVVGQVLTNSRTADTSTCQIDLLDDSSTVVAHGKCDDGSDASVIASEIAYKCVTEGIWRVLKISPETVKLALTLLKADMANTFTFEKVLLAPSVVLHLPVGKLALRNICFLVAESKEIIEGHDLLIGAPILQHFRVNTHTLLGEHRYKLNDTDCINEPVYIGGGDGIIGRYQVQHVATKIQADRPGVDQRAQNLHDDPFSGPLELDPVDDFQYYDFVNAVWELEQRAVEAGLPTAYHARLRDILNPHIDIFRVGLSSGPPVKLPPLKIQLLPDAHPVRVKLRNHSEDQRKFLKEFVENQERYEHVYRNPTAIWASAAHLVPEPGPKRWRFTVDLRPVNRFTTVLQFPMPIIEYELGKLQGSGFFATFDLSNGCWQIPLDPASQE